MLELNFDPFPLLSTPRLDLRALEFSDDRDIFLLRADEVVNRYLEGYRHETIEQTREFISKIKHAIAGNESIFWVMELKGPESFIGTICLWNISKENETGEVGYTMLPAYHGKGYMNEALKSVIRYGFENMKLKTIDAYTHYENTPSTKLLIRNGFRLLNNVMNEESLLLFTLGKEEFQDQGSDPGIAREL